tara:strand:+ start:47 stop:439 length:393 start_codon:yes stop_codon:yes gene_type:complete
MANQDKESINARIKREMDKETKGMSPKEKEEYIRNFFAQMKTTKKTMTANKGGMAKAAKKMKGGGMAKGKAKMAKKKMRGGGMAKRRMAGGGMAKMAKKKKMMGGGMAKMSKRKKMMGGGMAKMAKKKKR